MSYKITDGISEKDLEAWLKEALVKYGRYNGQGVNFTDADIAPIVMCTVVCGNEMLLVKRGYGLADAEGYWSTVNGFLDEIKPVKAIAQQELREELGLSVELEKIKVAQSYTLENPKEKRKYVVFACLVKLFSKPEIILDRENTDFIWTTRDKLGAFEMLDDLPYSIDRALALKG